MRSLIIALMIGGPASAEDARWISSLGDAYTALENANGGILTSVYPKFWFVEAGANSHVEEGPDIIYFGKSCDAFHKVFGKGTFGWANGGFAVEFESGQRIGFPRQELPWESLMHCEL